jgi:hypothetical protein
LGRLIIRNAQHRWQVRDAERRDDYTSQILNMDPVRPGASITNQAIATVANGENETTVKPIDGGQSKRREGDAALSIGVL